MAFKLALLCAALASAQAGFLEPALSYATPAAITSESANILRTEGNLAQLSTFSKTIDTPFSSVSKADVRLSNPAIYPAFGYNAPQSYSFAHSLPIYAKTGLSGPTLHYSSPAAEYSYAADTPTLYAKSALHYSGPAAHYSYSTAGPAFYAKPQLHYAAPGAQYAYAAPVVAPATRLAPVYAKQTLPYAPEGPVLKSATVEYGAPTVAAPGPILAHTSFTGYGTAYSY